MPDADADALPRTARWVTTSDDVETLVAEILDPSRTLPVVGVTAKPSAEQPFVDPEALAARLGDQATVWGIANAELNWALTDELPDRIDVYGGAVRAWMPIADGDEDPYPSDHPQWNVFNAEEGPRAIELIADYIELVAKQPLPAYGTTAKAVVTTVRKAGAELDLDSGHPAFASISHLVQHGEVFHAADVLKVGQEVTVRTGAWHPLAGRISVSLREYAPDPWERLAEVYEPGMLIEGGVSGVTAFGAFIELLPGVEGLLHKSKIADEFVEYVEDYVQEGDRITVRLLDLDPRGRKAGVSLRDVPRGAKAEPPASIFPGGPPWLPDPNEIAAAAQAEGVDDDGAPAGGAASDDDAPAGPVAVTIGGDILDPNDDDVRAVRAAGAALAPVSTGANPSFLVPTLPDPGYGEQLATLVELVLEHATGDDTGLTALIADALERGIATFDARLDEADLAGDADAPADASDHADTDAPAGLADAPADADADADAGAADDADAGAPGDADGAPASTDSPEAISELRTAAGELIDALRASATSDE